MKNRIIGSAAACAVLASLVHAAYAAPETDVSVDVQEREEDVFFDADPAAEEDAFIPPEDTAELSATYGNLRYTINNGEVTITGCSGSVTEAEVPAEIDGYPVTSIGDRAFYFCDRLTSIALPESITSIGDGAFYYCRSLTSITLPDGVTSIGDDAFSYCSLTSITLPESIMRIGNSAFNSGNSLTSVYISDLGKYLSIDFGNESSNPMCCAGKLYLNNKRLTKAEIPDGIEKIPPCAFNGCDAIKSIILPDSVTSIGDSAFRGCSSLTSITLPKGLTSIGGSAFSGCSSLTSITLPEGVTSIGDYTFSGCNSLTSITLPKGVTGIGDDAFFWCDSLTSITLPEGITSIGGSAFSGCSSLTSITLPEGVTSIGNSVFSSCSSLTSITLPEGITSIGLETFSFCYSLRSITLPEGVTSIGASAFSNCSSLKKVILPKSLTEIEKNAFSYCWGITVLYAGSQEEWEEIYIGSGNTALSDICYGITEYSYVMNADGSGIVLTGVTVLAEEQTVPRKIDGFAVTGIGAGAFSGKTQLKKVIIPDGVQSIGEHAFSGCSALSEITIPKSVTSIVGAGVFPDKTVIKGYKNSAAQIYAEDYGYEFVELTDSITMTETTLSRVGTNIVAAVKAKENISDKVLHIALYNADGALVEYIAVPATVSDTSAYVVFKDDPNAAYAKVFLWNSLTDMVPEGEAETVTIE